MNKCKDQSKDYEKQAIEDAKSTVLEKAKWVPKEDLWNLDNSIALFIAPRINKFKQNLHGYPGDITFEKWKDILEDIEYAFTMTIASTNFPLTNKDYDEERYERGLDYFRKYFRHLWD